jgi:S-adenosylmethionine:tRNA ribosyltransferase-isomerase
VKNIKLSDYNYQLPSEKIASYGLQQRDQSKLLMYKADRISHHKFSQISDLLPAKATLFFNNTKVIQARMILKRKTGAIIEVFLLSPANPDLTIFDTLSANQQVEYECMIGNLKKWPENEILYHKFKINNQTLQLEACLVSKKDKLVKFSWNSTAIKFADILEAIGHTPLPPYIKRDDEKEDKDRYQTVYSKHPGAVAAPTAGLHFTGKVLAQLAEKGIGLEQLTLHVSAGTFQPIKEAQVTNHPMHSERVIISRQNLEAVLAAEYIVAVGTTAMRTLESTFWFGVQLLHTDKTLFHIERLAPYQDRVNKLPTMQESFARVIDFMETQHLETITGDTEIFILPGYNFQVCDGLITNFHQPGSTLILLVAAFIGNKWREIYQEALANDYRFLSYGDSSILLK